MRTRLHQMGTKMRRMQDSKELLRQLADAMGNNRVRQELVINQQFVDEAKQLHLEMLRVYNALATVTKNMKVIYMILHFLQTVVETC